MKTKYLILMLMFIFLIIIGYAEENPRLRPEKWAKHVISENLKNWYKIDDKLYRSAQPDKKGFEDIIKFGIKNVLNLRDYHSDDDEAKGLDIKLFRIDMEAGDIETKNVIEALKIIKKAEGPILIHCWHGSDRTGTICAFYRIIFQNWTKEEAIDELINGGYGYHSIYDNIPKFIKDADTEKIKKAVFEK